MVHAATNLGKSGLQDWLIQRVSALILGAYILFLGIYLISNHPIHYHDWHKLFSCQAMRYSSLLALLALIAHAWIGIWTVVTDYIKITFIRFTVEIIVFIALLWYLFWGIDILWGR